MIQALLAQVGALFDDAALGIIAIDQQGRVAFANPILETMFGYAPGELIGQSVEILLPEEQRAAHARYRAIYNADPRPKAMGRGLELHGLHKDGHTFPIEARLSRLAHEGEFVSIALISEISTRKQLEHERNQLLAQAQADHIAADMAQRRQAFIANASQLIASSLDYETTLINLAHGAVPFLGDSCVIDLLESGQIRRVDAAHVLPEKAEMLRTLQRRYPDDIPSFVTQVLSSGQPCIVPELPQDVFDHEQLNDEQRWLYTQIAPRSLLSVPIMLREQVLGALTLSITESARRYTADDLATAQELALHAAQAIENARIFRAAQAETQHKNEALALLNTLVTSAPVGFAFMDREMRYQIINSYLASLNGMPAEQHYGKTMHDLYPDLANIVEPLIQRVLTHGEPIQDIEISTPAKHESEQVRHRLCNYYPVRTQDGELLGVGTIVRDITSRKYSEARLRESEERFRLLAEHAQDMIYRYRLKPNAGIEYVSPSSAALHGYSPEEMYENPDLLFQIIHPDDHWMLLTPPADDQPQIIRMIAKDGSLRWTEQRGAPIYDAQGNCVAIQGIVRDITERKQTEAKLQAHTAHLAVLANASQVFAKAGPDASAVMNQIAQQVASTLGDICIVQQLSSDRSWLHSVAVYDPDPAIVALTQSVFNAAPIAIHESQQISKSIKTGKSFFIPVLDHKHSLSVSADIFRPLLEQIPLHSLIVLPMRAQGQIIGCISLARHRASQPSFDEADYQLAQDLADRAALALSNAQLYQNIQIELEQRKQAEAALRNSEERYRFLVENAQDVIFHYQILPVRKFIYVSPSATALHGYTPEEHYADPELVFKMVHPDDRAKLQINVQNPGTDPFLDMRWFTKQGKLFWTEQRSVYIYNDDGEVVGFYGIIRDVTARKQAEIALRIAEAKYRSLIEQIPAIIFTADPSQPNQATYMSPQIEKILGFTPEEWIADPELGARQLHPDDRNRILDNVPIAFNSSNMSQLEFRMFTADRRIRWLQSLSWMVNETDAHQPLVQGILLDITERKQTEEALHARAGLAALTADIGITLTRTGPLQNMLRSCAEILISMLDGTCARIWTINEHSQMLELQASAGSHTHNDETFKRISIGQCKIGQIAQERRPFSTNRVSDLSPEDLQFWATNEGMLAFSGYPLIVEDRLVGVVALFAQQELNQMVLDALASISDTIALGIERKQAEAALAEERALLARRIAERTADLSMANAELARASRLKDEFLANMSHELRTPLNAILGRSEIMQEEIYGPLTPKQAESMRSIEESGRHLLTLINDILDLSKIEAAKLDLQIEPISISMICQVSLRMVAQAALAKRITLTTNIDSSLQIIQADERRLKQILVNLLSNAVKFTPISGKVGLEVHGDTQRQTITFTIWDTGIGIAQEHLPRLFQPFVQIDSGLSRQYEGTGLGLALVQRLTQAHDGSIIVESTPGQGSRFSVTLPWHTAVQQLNIHQALESDVQVQPALSLRRALVIDDSRAAADQLARYLMQFGAHVDVYPQGNGAIERAITLQPDVILLDIMLPDQAGWEILRQLKEESRTHAIPVVVVSVVDEPERARALGAAVSLVKPIDRSMLYSALQQAITPPAPREAPPAKTAPHLLLVEDNEANIEFMQSYLTTKGYDITLARNGIEAIEYALSQPIDAIIMDIQMPDMDGLEATRRIRAAQQRAMPIIALTAMAMPGDRERCIEAGADDYLTKPIHLRTLLSTIETHLNRQSDSIDGITSTEPRH